MTKPRCQKPGEVSLLTRRTIERLAMLRPDDFMNHVLLYEVAKSSSRHGQAVHGAMVMPNHPHFVVTDTTGDRSNFMRDTMSGVARVRNRDLGRTGYFWDSSPYGDTILLDRNAIERKLLYTWLNPVKAGLVSRAKDWPGYKVLPEDWGTKVTVNKPDSFYGRDAKKVVEYTPQPPPGYDDMSLEEVRLHFEKLLKREEDRIIRERKRAQKPFFGKSYILAQDVDKVPESFSESGQINPRFATLDGELMAKAQQRHKSFLDSYETERQRWKKGKRRCVFPHGTVWLRRHANITCAAPDGDEPGIFCSA